MTNDSDDPKVKVFNAPSETTSPLKKQSTIRIFLTMAVVLIVVIFLLIYLF